MQFYIGKIKIDLAEDAYGIRLTAFGEELPLPGQTIAAAQELLAKNFVTVRERYEKAASGIIPPDELDEISLQIVLYYFYLYNSWKYSNEKEKERDLAFLDADFGHPYTRDKIMQYFKNKYPNDYRGKSALLLGMTAEALQTYEANRDNFYDRFR